TREGVMCKRVLRQAVIIFILVSAASAQELWIGKDGSIRNIDARGIVAGEGYVYLATAKELYKTDDEKGKWEEIFSLPSGENEIGCVGAVSRTIYIGTKRGLFRSRDGGKSWRNVFKTIIPGKNNVLCMELSKYNPAAIALGTERGIFLSEDSGSSWRDISYNLRNKPIKCIGLSKDAIYAGGDDGLYVKRFGGILWERLFVKSALDKNTEEEPAEPLEVDGEAAAINCIMFKASRLYIGNGRSILYSDNGGKAWSYFSQSGLGGTINYILASRKSEKLYCATSKGIYEFDFDKAAWSELYKGMDKAAAVRSVIFDRDNEKSLWAVTSAGLYRIESGRYAGEQYIDVERNLKSLRIVFNGEPAIRELQQAALRFNEVDPEKIKKWRSESKARALLPKVSFGIDRNTTDLWHWEGGSTTKPDDDILRPGRDSIDWGATLNWELGDLIWSDDQTNIDVRSRLTIQTRDVNISILII
ncbi:MAG: hypothetical protein Q8R05_06005, partial [Candidatus Omnitrophota bacterium]|nr:hypothetical protein [Candidatus Omnitrophota bacterium]